MTEELPRTALSGREYYALRELFGIVSTLSVHAHDLEKRVRTIPGGWRDFRLMMALSDKLLGNILRTVPKDKLLKIQRDLKFARCEVKVEMDVTGRRGEDFSYVPDAALDRMIARVMDWECLLCEKRGQEVKKCPLRVDLDALYPWDFPLTGDTCPLAGGSDP